MARMAPLETMAWAAQAAQPAPDPANFAFTRRHQEVIFAVAHESFVRGGWSLVTKLLKEGSGVVLDVKWQLDRAKCPDSIDLWRL